MSHLLERIYWSSRAFAKSRAERTLPYRPIESILARQNRKIRSIVLHAYATVPYYREAMDRLGLKPGDFRTAEDLARLPLISGDELANSPDRFYSSRYGPDNTRTLESSGTNGAAKQVRYNHSSLIDSLAHGHRQRTVMAHFIGSQAEYREMGITRSESVSKHLREFYESHTWVPKRLDVKRCKVPVELSFAELIGRIDEFRPHLLTGYGSHLGALLRWAIENEVDFHHPKLVWYGADGMSGPDRQLIEEAGMPVLSTYQADEALRIGFQCEQREGFHVSLDDVAVRVAGPDGQAVPPGEPGEIVISNLSNRATVLLNYRLGDVITMPAESCPCGRTLPLIGKIAGRANDMIRLPDGELRHALIFLAPLQGIPGVNQVQLVQDPDGSVTVNTVCGAGADWESISRSIVGLSNSLMGQDLEISARKLAEIPREPSGKIRAVISHLEHGRD